MKKLIDRLKNNENLNKLVQNFFYLAVLQGVNFILPLISMPYLLTTLGAEKFGLVMFSHAFIAYFNIIVDFGFNLSATREVSVHRGNRAKIAEIFSSVMLIKSVLIVVSLLTMLLIIAFVPMFKEYSIIYLFAFGAVIGQSLFPTWFFLGIERMKHITMLNIFAKCFFTAAIFIFIQKESDFALAPLLSSLGFIISGIIAFFIAIRKYKIQLFIPSRHTLVAYLKDSSHFFLSRLSVSLYTSSNVFVLGIFADYAIVGYYSIAEKLYNALQRLYQPISNVLYPYVSKHRNIRLYKKIFLGTNIINLFILGFLFTFASFILQLIFKEALPESTTIFRILLVVALIVVPSILLGYPFLAALGYKNRANYSVVLGSVFHVIGLATLAFLGQITAINIALLLILTEGVVLINRILGVKKYNLWTIPT